MSDSVSYKPVQHADRAGDLAVAKTNAAPLKAFESALRHVQASASPPASAAAATTIAPHSLDGRGERSHQAATHKSSNVAKAEESGPRPASSSTTTAIAGGVQGNVAAETAAKTAQKAKVSTPRSAKSTEGGHDIGKQPESVATDAIGSGGTGPKSASASDTDLFQALAPTAALSNALTAGSTPDVKAALQTTLEGFADRSVPDAIKASLTLSGTPASAEIVGLLDNISLIAQDILENGPLSDIDVANLDELFWVSNWFDLFNQSYDPMAAIHNSVSSAMALPIDIFYTRALMRPLVDAERVVSPGLASRRAVRANTEPTPGAEGLNDPARGDDAPSALRST